MESVMLLLIEEVDLKKYIFHFVGPILLFQLNSEFFVFDNNFFKT
jgi:hypothetical protein